MDGSFEREKSLERQIRAFHWVRLLAELPRLAGSPAEREAAARIEGWVRELGVDEVRRTPVASRPRVGWVLALHMGLAALGVVWGGLIGAGLAVLSAWSLRRELAGGPLLLSRLLPAPTSSNVVARAGAAEPSQRVVLSAHMDCAQAGWIFSGELARLFARRARAGERHGPPPGPHVLPLALVFAGAGLAVAVWLGAGGLLVGGARFLLAAVLLLGAGSSLQWASARPSPGANDNASAVAAMLTCAEQLLAQLPERTELWIVATGAEEVGCRGMHAFCDAHRDWSRESTHFVNFECVGGGSLHWVRSEGTLHKTTYPPMLLELARRISVAGLFGDVTATDLLAGTDGHVPARAGFPTLSLVTLEEGVPRNYHRETDLPEALDMPTLIRSADFGAAVAYAVLRGEAGPIAIL